MSIKNYMKLSKIKKIISNILHNISIISLLILYFQFPSVFSSIIFMENKNITHDILLIILLFVSSIFFFSNLFKFDRSY